jgi:uncharacterized protein
MQDIIQIIARELGKDPRHVANVVALLDEGNTIPFIARYRKELHGAMDDTSLRTLEERLGYLRGLQERRDAVKKSIAEQGKLTEELSAAIDGAATLSEVEDLYRPTSKSAAPGPPWPGKRAWGPWRSCSSPRRRTVRSPWRRPPATWTPTGGVETAGRRPGRRANDIVAESMLSDDAARCARRSGRCCCRQGLGCESQAALRRRTPSTGSTTISPSRCGGFRATRSWR